MPVVFKTALHHHGQIGLKLVCTLHYIANYLHWTLNNGIELLTHSYKEKFLI